MVIKPHEDGITHINVYSRGLTSLGQSLSNFAHIAIFVDGNFFQSLEGYWYWLGNSDSRFMEVHGYEAKKLGRSLPRIRTLTEQEFQGKILAAMRLKVQQNRFVKDMLVASNLPFTHYYVYGVKVVDAGYPWIVEGWEEIRREERNKILALRK